jgi:aminoglycoside phosphotransferase (APT) family kinase protein
MFYVMEKLEGRHFSDPLLPDLPPPERRAAYLSMVETMAKLHAVTPADVGLEDFGRPGNYMARQVERWTKQYRASTVREIPAMERLIAWLPTTVPAQTRTSIVHGDFKLDNMLFAGDAPRLVAVLDWELSTIGEPLCDLTYMLMGWGWGPIAELADPAAAGLPTRAELVSTYCRLTGRDALPDLDWFFAYNFFRSAAIVEGIVGRVREGTARDPRAAALADRAPLTAELAWRLAERAGA